MNATTANVWEKWMGDVSIHEYLCEGDWEEKELREDLAFCGAPPEEIDAMVREVEGVVNTLAVETALVLRWFGGTVVARGVRVYVVDTTASHAEIMRLAPRARMANICYVRTWHLREAANTYYERVVDGQQFPSLEDVLNEANVVVEYSYMASK